MEPTKHDRTALDPLLVGRSPLRDHGDQPFNPHRLRTSELRVLEIDVVNDLRDGGQSGVRGADPLQQNFEGAAVALIARRA